MTVKHWTQAEKDTAVAMARDGKRDAEISDALPGRRESTVCAQLSELRRKGIEIPNRQPRRPDGAGWSAEAVAKVAEVGS